MLRIVRRLRGSGLIIGVLLAAIGGGFLSNWLLHGSGTSPDLRALEAGFLKATSVSATATHGNDTVIMCTGEVDVGIEAVYVLDVVTGELKGAVLNVRNGRFVTGYTYSNVAKDLGSDGVKNPHYLMVTGEAQMNQGYGGNPHIGRSVLYIAESNSGTVACYAAPWSGGRTSATNFASASMIYLDHFTFRQGTLVRPQ